MRTQSETGFTLIEMILSLTSFAVGCASLLALTIVIGQRNVLSREVAAATLIAQTRIERLRLAGYDALTDTGTVDGTDGPLDAVGMEAPAGKYEVSWDIQADTPEAEVKRVIVTVSWETAYHRPKQVILDTLVADDAP